MKYIKFLSSNTNNNNNVEIPQREKLDKDSNLYDFTLNG
tara:strand:- start:66 stop:182 length:117 start_codon:yes stop_codon:yes gene_type:complete